MVLGRERVCSGVFKGSPWGWATQLRNWRQCGFELVRRRHHNRSRKSLVAASVSNEHSSSIDESKIRDTYVPQSHLTASLRPYTVVGSTDGWPADYPSFLKPSPIFPLQIQSEDYPRYSNLPNNDTATSARFRADKQKRPPMLLEPDTY